MVSTTFAQPMPPGELVKFIIEPKKKLSLSVAQA